MVKNENGSYSFKSEIVPKDKVNDYLNKSNFNKFLIKKLSFINPKREAFYFNTMGIFGFFSKDKKEKLDQGLKKTRKCFEKLSRAVAGKSVIDELAFR